MAHTNPSACLHLFKRDLQQVLRQPAALFNPLLFFIVIISLFPLAIPSEQHVLTELAPGAVWLAALLAHLLALERLFSHDINDGSLAQLILSPYSLPVLISGKVWAHWLSSCAPLLIVTPLFALLLGLSSQQTLVLLTSLFLGSPILSFIGAIGSALTVNLVGRGVLLALLLLPLYSPVLIFGVGSVHAVTSGASVSGLLALLAALLLITVNFAPFAIAAVLRIIINE